MIRVQFLVPGYDVDANQQLIRVQFLVPGYDVGAKLVKSIDFTSFASTIGREFEILFSMRLLAKSNL